MEINFYYGQEITADEINGIAVDLGAETFSVFKDAEPYAVDQLNQITQALVGNGITSNGNKFQIEKSDDNIVINTGVGVFSTGKKITLKTPLTLPYQEGELYIENDESANTVRIAIGELPDNEYIHLATLDENGELTDRRVYAKAKVDLPSEGNSYRKNVTGTVYADTDEEISLNITNASKVFIRAKIADYERIGIFDIETSTFTANDLSAVCALVAPTVSLFVGNNSSSTWRAYVGYEGVVNDVATFVVQATADAAYDIDFYVFGGI